MKSIIPISAGTCSIDIFRTEFETKGAFSGLRQLPTTENSLKIMKNEYKKSF